MKKKEVIAILKNEEPKSGIMEIICDVYCGGLLIYPNKSILVLLWGYNWGDDSACDDDQIIMDKHWCVYNGISEFNRNTYVTHKYAEKNYERYYYQFKEVKPFISDFK